MSISSTIKSVSLGALTAASMQMTAASQPRNASKPKLDADGNPIEDSTSTDINKKKTETPNEIKDPKSEAAKKAAADKAVKDSVTVPASNQQQPITGAGIIAQQQADAKAAAEAQAAADAKASNNPNSQWQGLNAELPSFNSSNSMPRGEDLQKTLATDDPSKLIGGFKSPETPSSSPDSQAAQGAALGGGAGGGFGGLGGANAGPGGININSGNVNINSNNGSGNLGSFNNNGGGNVENFNNSFDRAPAIDSQPVERAEPSQLAQDIGDAQGSQRNSDPTL